MKRAREFYARWRLELAFIIVLYVWVRLTRYEYHRDGSATIIFDRWTTRVDKPALTKDRFVADPAPKTIP